MWVELDLQVAGDWKDLPAAGDFEAWVSAALKSRDGAELTVRIVDRKESRELNRKYRGKDRETNVLSFPADLPGGIDVPLLGDIVICAPLVAEEAEAQGKAVRDHWAHLTIHGVLHLLGHNHVEDADAEAMEALETALLQSLGIGNPYA